MGGLGRYARKDLKDKKCVGFIFYRKYILLTTCKDLGVDGWCLENSYSVRILNPLEIIGRSLRRENKLLPACLVI